MGVLSGAEKHATCFDQGFKYFCEIFSLKLTTVFFFTAFKARFGGGYFAIVLCNNIFTCRYVDSQEKREIMRSH